MLGVSQRIDRWSLFVDLAVVASLVGLIACVIAGPSDKSLEDLLNDFCFALH
jgi:hypothetical protein